MSSGAMIGRRWIFFHSSSSMKPTWIGSRRIWNALTPTIAPAMRSRTYAFIPWITATTATRNPTDTMIPSSVKNERSLWLHAVWSAWRMASVSCMAGKINGEKPGKGARTTLPRPLTLPRPFYRLFVPQRLDRIEPGRPARGVESEAHPRQGRGAERGDDRPQRHVRGDRGEARDGEGEAAPHEHPRRPAHERQGRRLHQELPQDRAPRRAERFTDADLPRALGHRDHHDGDDADAAHHEPDGREHEHHEEEHPRDLVP